MQGVVPGYRFASVDKGMGGVGRFTMKETQVVLLVDEAESDLILMRVALGKAGLKYPIQEARDGQEAIDYLSGAGRYANRERYPEPCLVITELWLPRVDGFELLKWLKERPEFERLPRIVLTGLALREERKRAEELGCWEYLVKPTGYHELIEVAARLDEDWIKVYCAAADK